MADTRAYRCPHPYEAPCGPVNVIAVFPLDRTDASQKIFVGAKLSFHQLDRPRLGNASSWAPVLGQDPGVPGL